MKIIKEILLQDSIGANCAGKAANEPPSARKGGSLRLPRSRMVSTLIAFRKRNTGEFTELDRRFRGRERKAGESSLRVSMTRPWGTRALLALRLLSGGNNVRQNAAFRKISNSGVPCRRSQNNFFCPGNPAHCGVLPEFPVRSLGRRTPSNFTDFPASSASGPAASNVLAEPVCSS